MRQITIAGTDIHVSRLSFGTASLHRVTSRRRRALLIRAVDHGFTHFDTAPYYGFGIAEQELGRFLHEDRDRLTVTTKVGLYPPLGSDPTLASVWTRKLGSKLFPFLSRAVVDWSIATASNSLRRSLQTMKLNYIDMLLLHEPVPNLIDSDAFFEWLKKEERKGTIRTWGVAGDGTRVSDWIRTNHPLTAVLQLRDSLDRCEADVATKNGRELQMTYGYLSSAEARDMTRSAEEVLSAALRRNTTGSIIVSTRHISRVSALAAVADRTDG
jgi:aryl-alcohol dehydrogenase-like predicted oxidoreductase